MHFHHADNFNGIETGVRFAEYGRIPDEPATRPTPTNTGGTAAKHPAGKPSPTKPTPSKSAPSKPRPTEPPGPTPVDQAKEAVKDGKISSAEKKVLEKAPVKDALAGQKETLRKNVDKAEGAAEQWRDDKGKLILRDGKPQSTGADYYPDTEHEQRVQDLTDSKDKQSLDALDSQIKALKDAGVTTGLSSLEKQRADRLAAEQQVASVIEDKESLRGTYEAEKVALEGSTDKNADNDYEALRIKASKWIDQFNANGGQYYEGNDWFGDDWDESKVDFNRLADRFHDDPDKLNDFAKVQGKNDDSGGDTAESMENHIADVAKDDPELAKKIALRYQAANELTTIFKDYNTARDSVDGNKEQIEQLNGEISILDDSIKTDRAALSKETLDAIDKNNVADTDVIPAETVEAPHKPAPSTPTKGGPSTPTKTEPTTPNKGGGSTPTKTEPSTPKTREVQIDYNTPEHRDQVLKQAREQNLVPAENSSFNDKGEAVYKVQPNDSYWRIADMSDGKPPHEFDYNHFEQTVRSNSERFGRDPGTGLIHPNEDVVIPGRSINDLVTLMNLPTTETVPVEEEPQEPTRPIRGAY